MSARGWSRRSRRYSPSITEKSNSMRLHLRAEALVPDSGGSNQVGVFAQRCHGQFRFLKRHKATTGSDAVARLLQKQASALHDTTPENDRVGNKHRHQVGESETEIVAFAVDCLPSPGFAGFRQLADLLCSQTGAVWAVRWGVTFDPRDHRRASRKRLPTAMEAAIAKRAGGIDSMVANFRMSLVGAAIKMTIENDADPDTGSHRDINQAR